MRQRTVAAVAAAVAVALGAGEARAERSYVGAAAWKLGHGVLSILYSPVDGLTTPCAYALEFDRKNGAVSAGLGFGLGVVAGLFNGDFRAILGLAEVLTFPLVGDAQARRPFRVEPILGWTLLEPPRTAGEPVRTGAREARPARD